MVPLCGIKSVRLRAVRLRQLRWLELCTVVAYALCGSAWDAAQRSITVYFENAEESIVLECGTDDKQVAIAKHIQKLGCGDELIEACLARANPSVRWGFHLGQSCISRVENGSPAR